MDHEFESMLTAKEFNLETLKLQTSVHEISEFYKQEGSQFVNVNLFTEEL